MRIYVKANTNALMRAHDKLVELDKNHNVAICYSKQYGHYAVIDLFDDVMNCVGVLTSYGVEQLPKKEKQCSSL